MGVRLPLKQRPFYCILFYFYCFLWAHFLATEAPDAFFVIINRRIFPAFSEIYCFVRYRTALYANSATNASLWLNVRFLLENIQRFCKPFFFNVTATTEIYT